MATRRYETGPSIGSESFSFANAKAQHRELANISVHAQRHLVLAHGDLVWVGVKRVDIGDRHRGDGCLLGHSDAFVCVSLSGRKKKKG